MGGKKSAQGREFKVYKEREGKKGRKRWKGKKKGKKGREKGKKVKNQLKNFACDTHLKFTKGKRIQLKNILGGKEIKL